MFSFLVCTEENIFLFLVMLLTVNIMLQFPNLHVSTPAHKKPSPITSHRYSSMFLVKNTLARGNISSVSRRPHVWRYSSSFIATNRHFRPPGRNGTGISGPIACRIGNRTFLGYHSFHIVLMGTLGLYAKWNVLTR